MIACKYKKNKLIAKSFREFLIIIINLGIDSSQLITNNKIVAISAKDNRVHETRNGLIV